MKKNIKRIGIIATAIAILLPFMKLPKVNATDEDCTHHLQSWFFLDASRMYVNNDGGFFERNYNKYNSVYKPQGYTTFTNFLYAFPEVGDDKYIKINNTITVDFTEEDTLLNFSTNLTQFWEEIRMVNNESNGSYYYKTSKVGAILPTTSRYWSSNLNSRYTDQQLLVHGVWTRFNEYGVEHDNLGTGSNLPTVTDGKNHTLQNIIQPAHLSALKFDTQILGATYNGEGIGFRSTSTGLAGDEFSNFINAVVNENKYIYVNPATNDKQIAVEISRQVSADSLSLNDSSNNKTLVNNNIKSVLRNYIFGIYNSDDNNTYIFTTKEPANITNRSVITGTETENGYYAYLEAGKELTTIRNDTTVTDELIRKGLITNYLQGGCMGPTSGKEGNNHRHCVRLSDITSATGITGADFYDNVVYYWPTVLNIDYSVCSKTEETPATGKWQLAYDLNVSDNSATNRPDAQEATLGNSLYVSETVPTRKGYAFKNWCTDREGKATCYNSKGEVKSPDTSQTITLFAQWGEAGTTDQKKTGVISYVIAFVATGAIAGAIYIVTKRKNLFKQI